MYIYIYIYMYLYNLCLCISNIFMDIVTAAQFQIDERITVS